MIHQASRKWRERGSNAATPAKIDQALRAIGKTYEAESFCQKFAPKSKENSPEKVENRSSNSAVTNGVKKRLNRLKSMESTESTE